MGAAAGGAEELTARPRPRPRFELFRPEEPQVLLDRVKAALKGHPELPDLGRFGPDPHVWTLYVALYAVAVFGAFVCLAFGISQWVAGGSPWVLYLSPLSVVLAGLVYGAAYVGQGLGSDQMYRVRVFLRLGKTNQEIR
jgi:hypothetical protein